MELRCSFVVWLNAKTPKDKTHPREIEPVGDAIRTRRADLRLRQKDVANIIGCDETNALNWEKRHTSPATNKIFGIRSFLRPNAKRQKTEGFGFQE